MTKEEYNAIPVYYCKHCLSLRIMDAGLSDLLYCDKCSATDIGTTSILKWLELYKKKYRFNLINIE